MSRSCADQELGTNSKRQKTVWALYCCNWLWIDSDLFFVFPEADGVFKSVKAGMWAAGGKALNTQIAQTSQLTLSDSGISRSWPETLSEFKCSLIHQYSQRVFNQD